ncbi:MAG: DNA polymerase III subunit gamma/tau [Kiritimatiellia bacterium]|jgi:DNA polymerase-3 subunit gamma/tau|nr:DNA polymerase III subunit gamma/tau [Kiritimatiellia bacterium]MDP6847745.1 DNA polymerase III subunit gamma/tau [Kiritimatiellia bacterium]
MAYQVLARKWRPQQFDDVVGQAHVTETLKNALKNDRLAHAYLFVGPRGIGKTSIARIFSKALNCEKGPTTTPCDECSSCGEIAAGTSLDVLEIDGASNNGVDQVRDLRDTVKYAPTRGKFKIYIIDEVHMLSTAAFNALLKTLEEPPPHVKFIFATTEPEKILPTIISRCQRFDLRRIPVPQIVERLELVAKDEKVKIDDDALLAVARGSEGGLRDAESALDQLISFKGKKISEEDVLSVFGLVSRALLEELAEKILTGDIEGIVMLIARLDESGKDLRRLVLELMEYFRNLLIVLNVKEVSAGLDLAEAQVAALTRQAELTNTDRVLRLTRILGETVDGMRFALSRRTLLETALIRCARAAVVVSLEEILAQINELRKSGGAAAGGSGGGPSSGTVKASRRVPEKETAGEDQGEMALEKSAETVTPVVPIVAESRAEFETKPRKTAGNADELAKLLKEWREICHRVGKIAVMAGSPLLDARPIDVLEDRVVLGFDPEFEEDLGKFKSGRNRKALEHVLAGSLGRGVAVECKLAEIRAEVAEEQAVEARELDVSPSQDVAVADQKREDVSPALKSMGEWLNVPEVEKVLEMFNGSIIDVRA